MWASLPSSGAPAWGAQGGVETHHFSGGTFVAELTSIFSVTATECGANPS